MDESIGNHLKDALYYLLMMTPVILLTIILFLNNRDLRDIRSNMTEVRHTMDKLFYERVLNYE